MAAALIARHTGRVTAPSSSATDMNPERIAAGSCRRRENAAGATLRTGCEKIVSGQFERFEASAKKPSAVTPSTRPTTSWSTFSTMKRMTFDPASGRPNLSSARALARSKPRRKGCGENHRSGTRAAAQPASRPIARLIAPKPDSARTTVTAVPSQILTWSTIILRSWRKFRVSSPIGVATMPSTITTMQSTLTTLVAAGSPIAEA